jgi:acyl-CoA reductase-like NAD-dependent aldehyde dehydrogenase
MVKDVVDAGVLPVGALSVICGSSAGLMDQLQAFDVVSFTGSAETGKIIRSHRAVTELSVRCNIEADSLNSALLSPAATADSDAFKLLVAEVAREMTVKSGQKCTAIRRVFVPRALRTGHRGQVVQNHRRQPAQRDRAHGRAGEPGAKGQRAGGFGPAENRSHRAV